MVVLEESLQAGGLLYGSLLTSVLACDNSNGISKSGSPVLMVHFRGCGLVVLLTGMVLTLVIGSPANLLPWLDGTLQWNQYFILGGCCAHNGPEREIFSLL